MSSCASCAAAGGTGDLCQPTLLNYLDKQASVSATSVAFLPRCVAIRANAAVRAAYSQQDPKTPDFLDRGGRIIGTTPSGIKADPAAQLAIQQMALRAWRNYKPAARLHG